LVEHGKAEGVLSFLALGKQLDLVEENSKDQQADHVTTTK
jgi:hypothetical protein